MFETAELGRKVDKAQYDAEVPELRTRLLKAQVALEKAGVAVCVLVNGAEAAGKSDTVNILHEWLDARYLSLFSWEPPSQDESERPEYWRYWMSLPRAGRIGIFLGNWYTQPIVERVLKKKGSSNFLRATTQIQAFERSLADEDVLLIKLWFHVTKKQQRERLEKLASSKRTRWRVTKRDWIFHSKYDKFQRCAEQVLRETSTGHAPWNVIEAGDNRYRNLAVGRQILEQLEARLAQGSPQVEHRPEPPIADPATILDRLDMSLQVPKAEYEKREPLVQGKLNALAHDLYEQRRSAIFVFEGSDAAGKGGAIRRVSWSLDARQYRVIPIAAPTDEERDHHYLWRFWRHLPRRGRITIYDRSWYGRVLVERVEGFASAEQWHRAYQEINEFEEELSNDGIIICKFWLQITPEEQLRRFQAREREPWKQHKITPDDYRNREKSHQYEAAAMEMIARNSTSYAPWTLVEANDKRHARLKVLETISQRLKQELR